MNPQVRSIHLLWLCLGASCKSACVVAHKVCVYVCCGRQSVSLPSDYSTTTNEVYLKFVNNAHNLAENKTTHKHKPASLRASNIRMRFPHAGDEFMGWGGNCYTADTLVVYIIHSGGIVICIRARMACTKAHVRWSTTTSPPLPTLPPTVTRMNVADDCASDNRRWCGQQRRRFHDGRTGISRWPPTAGKDVRARQRNALYVCVLYVYSCASESKPD